MKCNKLKSITAYKLTTNTEDSDVYIHNDEFGCGGDAVQVYLKSEADKCIESLRTDYKDACGKLHTVGLIKDELYQKLLHTKYKRCVASAAYWVAVRYNCVDYKHRIQAENNLKKWLELSKRYKETKEFQDGVTKYFFQSEVDEAIAELKDVIRKHEEKNKWRSPIDEKPERGQLVLVAFSERQKMHYFPIDVVRWDSSYDIGEYEVNAWMPLPQPPKEVDE